MLLARCLRDWMIGSPARRSPPRRRRPRLELLEVRSVLTGGWVDWADVGDFGGPVGDSLNPASPSTIDVIDFTLHDDVIGDVYGTEPSLSFDLANKTIDVVFAPRPEPVGYAGFYVQGVYGQLESLDAGEWTLNGPKSSITFTVGPEYQAKLAISDVMAVEGDSGTTSAVFTVSLSAPSDQLVTVNFATADGTAKANSNDYVPASGSLTFDPGETTKTITVLVNGDARDEYDDTFFVKLSSPTNAAVADYQGVGTILDDDPPPSLTISDVTRAEGNSGATSLGFTVSLSAASDKLVTVGFATADGTAKTSNNDYVALSGFLALWPGQTSWTITVQVTGDTRDENDETFAFNLTSSSNATITDSQAVGTILDDDSPPALAMSDVTLAEGRSSITYFVFTVSLSAVSDKTISVNFATANGTAKVSDNDYVTASGTLTFAPGETIKTITVQVLGDKKKEAHETFFLNLSGAVHAVFADSQGLGTILNDD